MLPLVLAIFLITLSIFIHELGHFLVARWRGMVVPRFSIFGIGKPIVSRKWRGVEYCVCWLPIGAYVMVPQLTDLGSFEGEIPEEAKNLPPASYLSKVLVAVAGPVANILFALALGCVVWAVGVNVPAEYNRTEIGDVAREIQTSEGKTVPGPAAVAGLKPGDIVRKIDGQPVANYQDILNAIVLGSGVTPDGRRVVELEVERNGNTLTRQVYPELVSTEKLRAIGIAPRAEPELVVDAVTKDSPAALAGFLPGDQIVAVDGKVLARTDELSEHFQKKFAEPSRITVKRDGKEITVTVQPRLQTVGGKPLYRVGIAWRLPTVLIRPTPFQQIGDALHQAYQMLSSLLNRKSDIGVRHLSGPVGIVDQLQQVASFGVIPALSFLIAINVSLAILNLLPIPVLDGGHIMFATLGKLRGRPVSPIVMQNAVAACFFLIIGLMIYVGYNDFRRVIQNRFNTPEPTAPAKAADPAQPAK